MCRRLAEGGGRGISGGTVLHGGACRLAKLVDLTSSRGHGGQYAGGWLFQKLTTRATPIILQSQVDGGVWPVLV